MSLAKATRKIKRAGKTAVQFRITSTFEFIELECKGTWRPDKLSVVWQRNHRKVKSNEATWSVSDDFGPNGARGRAVFNPAIAVSLVVTLYRDAHQTEFDEKEYKYQLQNDGPAGKKVLATFNCNVADFVGIPSTRQALDLNFKCVSKKVKEAKLGITLESQFLKEGKAMDDDMQSTFSAMSTGQESVTYDEDEEEEEEPGQEQGGGAEGEVQYPLNQAPGFTPASTNTVSGNRNRLNTLQEEPEEPVESLDVEKSVVLGTGEHLKRETLPREAPAKPPRPGSFRKSESPAPNIAVLHEAPPPSSSQNVGRSGGGADVTAVAGTTVQPPLRPLPDITVTKFDKSLKLEDSAEAPAKPEPKKPAASLSNGGSVDHEKPANPEPGPVSAPVSPPVSPPVVEKDVTKTGTEKGHKLTNGIHENGILTNGIQEEAEPVQEERVLNKDVKTKTTTTNKNESAPPQVEQPLAKVEQPPAKVEQTPAKIEQPPAKVEQPPAKIEQPPAKVEQPPAKIEQPPAKVEQPPAKIEQLPAEMEQQPDEVEPTVDAYGREINGRGHDHIFEAARLLATTVAKEAEKSPGSTGSTGRKTVESIETYTPPTNPYLEETAEDRSSEPPSPALSITDVWLDSEVQLVDCFGSEVGREKLEQAELIGLYFSAGWCPPCRRFLPKLVKFYHHLKQHGKHFEILYISSDYSKQDMLKYMKEQQMPWLAIAYEGTASEDFRKKYNVSAVPLFKIMGKKGNPIEDSAKRSVESASSGAAILKLYNKWHEKAMLGESGGEERVSTSSSYKEKKGLLSKVKASIQKSKDLDDVSSLPSDSSPPRSPESGRRVVDSRLHRKTKGGKGMVSAELLEEKEERIQHLEEVNRTLKQTNDELSEELGELRQRFQEVSAELDKFKSTSKTLQDQSKELIANLNMRGWLYKRGVRGPTASIWRRRYFRLDQGSKLYYYKNSSEGNPQGFIDVDKVISVQEVTASQQDKNHATFTVQCDGRTFQLQAHDEPSMRKWMEAILYMTNWRRKNSRVNIEDL